MITSAFGVLIVGLLICGVIGAHIAPAHGFTPVAGLSLGFLFGLFGLVYLVLQSPVDDVR